MIIAWALYYFGMSFTGLWGELPWAHCNPSWGTTNCFDFAMAEECNKTGSVYFDQQCFNLTNSNQTWLNWVNNHWAVADFNKTKMSPAQVMHRLRLQDLRPRICE